MIGDFKNDRKELDNIYLIDFGISQKYLDDELKHMPFLENLPFKGNAIFSSKNAFSQYSLSRRDDIISLVYLSISENNKEKVNTIYLKSSPIELMETNYKIIEELLKEKGINNASLFLLLLENKILNLFNYIKSRSKEERKLEENNFNLFVDSCLNEFNERKEELKKITSNSTECDKFSLKSILEEKFDINSYDKIKLNMLN